MRTFRSRFVCEYDGGDAVTITNALIPAGWVVDWSRGEPHYYHNADHARLGMGTEPVPEGGRFDTYRFVDDHDTSITAQRSKGTVPEGWIELYRDGTTFHFSTQANADAWLTENAAGNPGGTS